MPIPPQPPRPPAGLPNGRLGRGDHVMSLTELAEAELPVLRARHRELDARIAALAAEGPVTCSMEMQRLKRDKLALKDRITRLEDVATPDIIA